VLRGYPIVQCPRCLLAQTLNAEIVPEEFYDRDYFHAPLRQGRTCAPKGYDDYVRVASAASRTYRFRLLRLRRCCPAGRTLLDVGCGCGFFLRAAQRDGWDGWGLEVSQYASGYAREKLGLPVITGTVEACSLAGLLPRFDAVTLWDVLEHLPDPAEALRLLADELAPGGVLAFSTTDIGTLAARLSGPRWHLLNLPEHLWFFSTASLERLVRGAGLRTIRRRYEVCWYPLAYLAERLTVMLRGPAAAPPELPERLARLTVPFSFFDIVTVYAAKRGRELIPKTGATGSLPARPLADKPPVAP